MGTWQQYLEHLVIVDAETVESDYRPGSALNESDEELYAQTRNNSRELRSQLQVLLAAPELLAALKHLVGPGCAIDYRHADFRWLTCLIAKAEGRSDA